MKYALLNVNRTLCFLATYYVYIQLRYLFVCLKVEEWVFFLLLKHMCGKRLELLFALIANADNL